MQTNKVTNIDILRKAVFTEIMIQDHFKNRMLQMKAAGLTTAIHLDNIFPEHHQALYNGIGKGIFSQEGGYIDLPLQPCTACKQTYCDNILECLTNAN